MQQNFQPIFGVDTISIGCEHLNSGLTIDEDFYANDTNDTRKLEMWISCAVFLGMQSPLTHSTELHSLHAVRKLEYMPC